MANISKYLKTLVDSLASIATSGSYNDLSNKPTLGTASDKDVGTSANNVVQLDSNAKIPAVDGSQVINISYNNLLDTPLTTIPQGIILPFSSSSVPSGFLECDGSAISRTTYSGLFSLMGTTFGIGDGSTTFNIPDLRGEFIRGWDNSRGIDSGRSFGSSQLDEFKSHNHGVTPQSYLIPRNITGTGRAYGSGAIDTAQTFTADGGSETRPRNIALMYCIKY